MIHKKIKILNILYANIAMVVIYLIYNLSNQEKYLL